MAEDQNVVHLKSVRRIVVFVHQGQWAEGCLYLITLCDGQEHFEDSLKMWQTNGSICLYDGPPNRGPDGKPKR